MWRHVQPGSSTFEAKRMLMFWDRNLSHDLFSLSLLAIRSHINVSLTLDSPSLSRSLPRGQYSHVFFLFFIVLSFSLFFLPNSRPRQCRLSSFSFISLANNSVNAAVKLSVFLQIKTFKFRMYKIIYILIII